MLAIHSTSAPGQAQILSSPAANKATPKADNLMSDEVKSVPKSLEASMLPGEIGTEILERTQDEGKLRFPKCVG